MRMIRVLLFSFKNVKKEPRKRTRSTGSNVLIFCRTLFAKLNLKSGRVILEEPEKVVPEFPSEPDSPEISEDPLPEPSDIF